MKIDKHLSIKDLALIICKFLKDHNIDVVLTGGAVVSIYTDNKYQSYDLDFITYTSLDELNKVLKILGFVKEGRIFYHPKIKFFLDFPAPPISVGDTPVTEFKEIFSEQGYLKLLSPTHCVMDRLAAFYYWADMQSLEQAVMVAKNNNVNINKIKEWSIKENMLKKFNWFIEKLKLNTYL